MGQWHMQAGQAPTPPLTRCVNPGRSQPEKRGVAEALGPTGFPAPAWSRALAARGPPGSPVCLCVYVCVPCVSVYTGAAVAGRGGGSPL